MEIRPVKIDVKNDLGGEAPFDAIYSGESARITVDLNRFNTPLLRSIEARSRSATFPGAVGGFDAPGQVGTLMVTEGASFQLLLHFPFSAKAPFLGAVGPNSGGPMIQGYRFFAAYLDPESVQGGSASVLKYHLSFECLRVFSPTASGVGFGSFALYDTDVSSVVSLPLN